MQAHVLIDARIVCDFRADTMEGHDVLIMGTRTCRQKMYLNMQNI